MSTDIAPRPWRQHGVFVSDCDQTLSNMAIVRDAQGIFVGAFDNIANAVVCAEAVNLIESVSRYLVAAAAGDMLAALQNALPFVEAYADRLSEGGNKSDAKSANDAAESIRDAIDKACGE